MSGPGRKPGKGSRSISDDEAALWQYATRSLDPVKAKPRVSSAEGRADSPARTAPPSPPRVPAKPAGTNVPPPPRPRAPAAAKASKTAPAPLADFDRRKARQIASGRIEVEARFDLHGMRQRDAHAQLRGFLLDAYARGLKTVLVITGKGGEENADRFADLAGERQRGVLRRNVPLWLGDPDLRSVVLSFTQASVRHGGGGALYVQLRRKSR